MTYTDREILIQIARQDMLERGLLTDWPPEVLIEVNALAAAAALDGPPPARDLRDLPWCSIDNDDSRDLDQLSVAEPLDGGLTRLRVAIADVDSLVARGSQTDACAAHNTTSVYPAGRVFPMLPERLSTNLTSLNPGVDRRAMVVEMDIDADGSIGRSGVYRALVHNRAQLAYNAVGAWLEGDGPLPEAAAAVPGLDDNLRLQDAAAQRLRALRHTHGALRLQTIEGQVAFDGDRVSAIVARHPNRATELIEDLMIAANGVVARFLADHGSSSIRRVVRVPERWDRIVELARRVGYDLAEEPDPVALDAFLEARRAADPVGFPDLSLAVIKLLGSGEYVAVFPGEEAPGHFGLAVQDYTHSTAPNRRYSDLLTQRLIKAVLDDRQEPYRRAELVRLANQCTDQEDAANKVERRVAKSAAALLLQDRLGDRFDATVTGAGPKGTWVRVLDLPVEGKVVRGFKGLDVGDRVAVELLSVDVPHGWLDFRA
jgi:exoribonuclease-2